MSASGGSPGQARGALAAARRPLPSALPALVVALGICWPSSARADPEAVPARVILVKPGCTGTDLDEDELVRLLEIELRADGVGDVEVVEAGVVDGEASGPSSSSSGAVPGASLAVLRLEGVCDRVGPLSVTIDDAATDKRVRREVDLGGVTDEARSRAVALAIAELLRASWMELVLPSSPAPKATVPVEVREAARGRAMAAAGSPSEDAPAMEPLPAPSLAVEPSSTTTPPPDERPGARIDREDATKAHAARVWLGGSAGARGFLDGDALFGGLRAEALFPLTGPLRARAGASAAYSPGEHALGDVDLFMVNGRAAVCFALAGGSYLVEVGPFVELGWGHARGAPSQDLVVGDDASALVALTGLTFGARFALTGSTWLDGSVDFGPTLSGLSALVDGQRERSIDGLSGGLHLGLAWAIGR